MRIHIQNPENDPLFAITQSQWDAAAARAGAAHAVTIADREEAFAAALPTAEALIAPPSWLARAFSAPRLRLIFCTTAGVDALAPFTHLPPGAVLVCNRGIHGEKAGDYAIMALLMLAARMPALIASQAEQRWEPRYTSPLSGRRLAVIGLGALGAAAAARAGAFGMKVTGITRTGAPHPACHASLPVTALDEALPAADFLLLACPLTPATRNLIDRRRLSLLPPGAGLVNIGRGAVIDEDALADLLDAGRLGGAVLDVVAHEPLPPGHRLWRTSNLVLTPHVSADDPATYNPRTLDRFFAALAALARGAAVPNVVDFARCY
ncbi:MAG TPA: NAD(P)-dependent oxidoreductase [Acetobacteraceae bacterium]|jgi:glyoxylate/hydroxypyruvate reductase|nr:NAD(P)-dependent oxidoreductase [Acetobacteraceae bacterium]